MWYSSLLESGGKVIRLTGPRYNSCDIPANKKHFLADLFVPLGYRVSPNYSTLYYVWQNIYEFVVISSPKNHDNIYFEESNMPVIIIADYNKRLIEGKRRFNIEYSTYTFPYFQYRKKEDPNLEQLYIIIENSVALKKQHSDFKKRL